MFFRKNKSEIAWESIITSLPISVYWKDTTGRYLNCNFSYAEYVGASSVEDVIGKMDTDLFFSKNIVRELMDDDQAVLKSKKPIVVEKREYYSVKMPLKNKKNEVIGIFGFSLDKVKHQNDISRELRLLDEIIAVMPGHVYWKDRECVLQGCNELQAQDSGLSSRQMIKGKTAYDLLTQDQSEREKQEQAAMTNSYDEEVMKSNKTMTFEESVVLLDKSIATFLSKKTPLHDEYGNVTGLVGISFDISDRKKSEESLKIAKEQAEAANHSKTEFLENMRHDIRTPLSGIVGFAQLIQKEAATPKIQEYADNLVLATQALLDFQNEILDSIKITTASDALVSEPFDLKKLVKKVVDLVRPKSIVKKLSLKFLYDDHLPPFVIGDAKRLFRILLELMTNALKFTSEGEIAVSTTLLEKTEKGLILRCEIKDTGIGIPSDQFDDIFIRFHRLSAASAGLYEGTGLGLTTVKQFVKELSGYITVRSTVNEGATFIVDIPLLLASDFVASEIVPEKIVVPTYVENPYVLLVEDHVMTAKVTQLLLFELGCRVDVATDAEQALEKVAKKQYDFILMDLGLPDTNGFLLAKKIRAHYCKPIPMVALTAHKESDAEKRCLASGMNAIFQKPLLKSTAIQLLNTYLTKDTVMEKNIIDLALGAKRLNQSETAARSMLDLLRNNIDSDKKSIHDALQKKDWKILGDVNHKLLGGLAYCGAPRLESACRTLQDALQQADITHIQHYATTVLHEIGLFKSAF